MPLHYSLWNKNFVSITLINLTISAVFYLSTVTTTSYSQNVLHLGEALSGLASGLFVVAAIFLRLITGRYIDIVNPKKIMIAAMIAYVITGLLYFVITSPTMLFLVRALHGMAYGAAGSTTGAIVARLLPNNMKGRGIGYYMLSIIIGGAIGPFLAIVLIKHQAYTLSFIIAVVFAVLGLVLSLFIKVRRNHLDASKMAARKAFKLGNFLEKTTAPLAAVAFFVAIGYGTILSFIGVYSQEINLLTAGSFFFMTYAAVSLVSRPLAGRLFDVKGAHTVIIPSLLFFSASLFLCAFSYTNLELIAAAVLLGLGYSTFLSAGLTFAIKVAPQERMGLATSTYYMVLDSGVGLGPYFMGGCIEHLGYRPTFALTGALLLVSLALYYGLIIRNDHRYDNLHAKR